MAQTPSEVPISHTVTEAPQFTVLLDLVQDGQQPPPIITNVSPHPAGWSPSNRSGIKRKRSEILQPAMRSKPSPSIAVPPPSLSSPGRTVSRGAYIEPWATSPSRSRSSSPLGSYRSLNIKGALSYLDLVKIKFQDHPDIYNQFLDIMKDLKNQTVDTLEVIRRVASLFTGYPVLIEGFNTFLPFLYHIGCSVDDDNQNTITFITPSCIHTQTPDGAVKRTSHASLRASHYPPGVNGPRRYTVLGAVPSVHRYLDVNTSGNPQRPFGQPLNDPLPPPQTSSPHLTYLAPQSSIHPPNPNSTSSVAALLSGLQGLQPHRRQHQQPSLHPRRGTAPSPISWQDSELPVEFNHLSDYVKKIKTRFASDPDTYKQFLEILQTYQQEQRSISSVYEQVAVLFDESVDLLDEFKQLLPDNLQSNTMENVVSGGSIGAVGRMELDAPVSVTVGEEHRRHRKSFQMHPAAAPANAESAANPGYDSAGPIVGSAPQFCRMPIIDLRDYQANRALPSLLPFAVNSSRMGQMHSMLGEDLGAQLLQEEIIFENEIQPFDSRGHFCDLFLGVHQKFGRVALKRLRHRGGGESEVRALSRHFQRETQIWLGLHHERILECLGGFTRDGHLFIVSPFMKNGTLYDWLRSGEHIGRERLRLIHELTSALVYLHSSNIVHGDVKANNVLLSDDFHVQLCDFGLTKLVGSNTTTTLKGAGSIRWQGPELWGNEPKTFKSDVYAFAMTIVEVLTSEIPFAGLIHDTAVLIAVYALDERPARVPEASPDGTSYAVAWDVAERCWPKDVDQRIHMNQAAELLLVDQET